MASREMTVTYLERRSEAGLTLGDLPRGKVRELTEEEIQRFGQDLSYRNKTHYTPDFSIILENGIDGIIAKAEEKALKARRKAKQK